MKKLKVTYDYAALKDGERQYDSLNLNEDNMVDAVYVRSEFKSDRYNPFIEALPLPRNNEEVNRAYTVPLVDFDRDRIMQYSTEKKIRSVESLRQLRITLPFHKELEDKFYAALLNSYRSRYIVTDDKFYMPGYMNDSEIKLHYKSLSNEWDAANVGFSLLGYSGCGKSSALKILLSHYPQVILHKIDKHELVQVVYLVVNAIPNNNFSALYISIGAALDNALGNFIPIYEEQVRKRKNLGDKAEKIRELVQKFNIGMIIFDEIQLIDFKNANEKSFESLLTLCNRTKVAIGVIGTEDAYEMMFSSVLRKARRTGALINANRYCSDSDYFKYITQTLFRYQWFDKHVPLTLELFETLFECSKGIVDQLIGIYMFMQIDYLKSKRKPDINREFILKVVNRHYPGIRKILDRLDKNPFESDKNRTEIIKKANSEMSSIFRNTQDEYKESVLESNPRIAEDLCRRVVHNVQNIFDEYSSSDIINAYNKVLNIKDNKELNEKKLTQETIKILTSISVPNKKTKKKPELTSLQLDRYDRTGAKQK